LKIISILIIEKPFDLKKGKKIKTGLSNNAKKESKLCADRFIVTLHSILVY